MSALTPAFPQLIRLPVGSYANANPVSTWRALVMRNNLQYQVNLLCQHRVNWVSAFPDGSGVNSFWFDTFSGDGVGGDSEDEFTQVWSQEFERTWQRSDYPCGLDVRVKAAVGAGGIGDVTIRVRILPASAPYNDLSYPAFFDVSESTTGVDTTCLVEGLIMPEERESHEGRFIAHSILEDGAVRSPKQGLDRIEVALTVPEDDEGGLVAVLVREFVCQSL